MKLPMSDGMAKNQMSTESVSIPNNERRKLEKKSKKMRLLGYSLKSKGYRLFDEATRKLFVRRDVEFNENFFCHKVPVTTPPDSEPIQKGEELERPPVPVKSHVQVEEEEEKSEQKASDAHQEPQRSQRSHKPPIRYGYEIVTHCVHHVAYNVREVDEPSPMREALASDHATEWKAAADSEYS